MTVSPYPVRVEAQLEPRLSRWLWLVKWVLALPHYLVLAFLWLAFVVLSLVAMFAILFTGRYPRSIFDFNVGVLRWSWRVAYYAYGALGTDRYPPFSLEDDPSYPARLEVEYPDHLSRGLVLVKWWLLAIPHYLVVGIFVGGGIYLGNEAMNADPPPWFWGGGLVGLLVFIAAVLLLFTGRYPQTIFDLVLGMNRWVLRVAGYAALMTDRYPPFRLDQGGADPGRVDLAPRPDPSGPGQGTALPAGPPPQGPRRPTPTSSWSTGRIIAVVVASLLAAVSFGFLVAGATLAVADRTLRDDGGFLMSGAQPVSTSLYAVTSDNVELHTAPAVERLPELLVGDAKVTVEPDGSAPVFVGIGRTGAVDAYLHDVALSTITRMQPWTGQDEPSYRHHEGGPPAQAPSDVDIWAVSAVGSGPQSLVWTPTDGDWTFVVMRADAGPGVQADISIGAEVPAAAWMSVILLTFGVTGLLVAAVVVIVTARGAGRPSTS